jgi:hypothetical protein
MRIISELLSVFHSRDRSCFSVYWPCGEGAVAIESKKVGITLGTIYADETCPFIHISFSDRARPREIALILKEDWITRCL